MKTNPMREANTTKQFIKRENGSLRVLTVITEPTMAQQQHKDQVDINNIIKKYRQTGELPAMRQQGVFADVSEIGDYHSSLQKVLDANAAFQRLPADLRLRFNNDPSQLLDFLRNPKNLEEGIKLGLYEKKPEKTEPPKNASNAKKPEAPSPAATTPET